jgi:alkylated DNA nucleotide flippase Atl1
MRAQEGTFRGLMTQDRQFRVPLYQRHYRWRTDQQEDLWQDILEQYHSLAGEGNSVPRHFIGSVVAVERDPDPLHDFRNFRIVDGQQRLTTLSVAIAALRDVASKDDPDQFQRFNAKYLVNTTEETGSERWARLVPGEEDAAAYWTVLTEPAKVSGHTAVGNAYRFFLKRIAEMHEAGNLQPERLATTIGDRLALVFVTVEEGERPHKIFESINATGVGLSQSDLLRNYLFMALGDRSNNVYTQHWRPLERALGTDGLEGLVRDDLQAAGEFVRQDQVYRTARRQLEPQAADLDRLEAHVRRLARNGAYYALFLQPDDPHEQAKELGISQRSLGHLKFLRAWGASTTYPLLLHLFGQVDAGRATSEQAEQCLEAIESFIVRRYLAAIPTNVLNRLFIQLIGSLPQGEPIDVALRRELSRDGRWPSNEQVRDGIAGVPYYSHGRPHQQRLVLQYLESHLRAEVDVDFDSADLSIEHVLPQTLSPEWKTELSEQGEDPQEVFDRLGHTLGNLTLTAWNSKLSNRLFERKQEILSDSELKLNEFLGSADRWGAEQIEERGRILADAATSRWSEPIPGIVSPHAGFDWSRVDQAIAALPAGSWTSYGDLAELVGTAAQPTANHVAKDPSLKQAYRVLSGDGSVSFNFQWHDPADARDPMEVLIGEGLEFDENDRADQAQRLRPAELEALLEANSSPLASRSS